MNQLKDVIIHIAVSVKSKNCSFIWTDLNDQVGFFFKM